MKENNMAALCASKSTADLNKFGVMCGQVCVVCCVERAPCSFWSFFLCFVVPLIVGESTLHLTE